MKVKGLLWLFELMNTCCFLLIIWNEIALVCWKNAYLCKNFSS